MEKWNCEKREYNATLNILRQKLFLCRCFCFDGNFFSHFRWKTDFPFNLLEVLPLGNKNFLSCEISSYLHLNWVWNQLITLPHFSSFTMWFCCICRYLFYCLWCYAAVVEAFATGRKYEKMLEGLTSLIAFKNHLRAHTLIAHAMWQFETRRSLWSKQNCCFAELSRKSSSEFWFPAACHRRNK